MVSAVVSTAIGILDSYQVRTFVKISKTLFVVFGAVAAVGLTGLYTFQSKLVYPAFAGDGHGVVDTPDKYGMDNYEDVDLTTSDGETIKLFVIKVKKVVSEKSKTVVILCPNAGNMGHALPIAQLFYYNMDCNVVLYSYRGYGHSSGSPSETGLKLDADAVMDYISKDEILQNSDLILHGRSLGGAVAIYMASKYPQMIKGVILENTFLSIRKVIPYLFPYISYFSTLCHQIWDSESLIVQIPGNIPVMFMNGLKDEIVPTSHMKKLYELSRAKTKSFHEFPEGHHNDTIVQDYYWKYVAEFVESI